MNNELHLDYCDNFSAGQIKLLQTKSAEIILYVNKKIIEAASNGLFEVDISTSNNGVLTYDQMFSIMQPLLAHFKSRGFKAELKGQSSILINWE